MQGLWLLCANGAGGLISYYSVTVCVRLCLFRHPAVPEICAVCVLARLFAHPERVKVNWLILLERRKKKLNVNMIGERKEHILAHTRILELDHLDPIDVRVSTRECSSN